jgi:hypothetical protein
MTFNSAGERKVGVVADLTPRDAVEMLLVEDLAALVSGDGFLGFIDDELGCRFRCPRCGFVDHNGGSAKVVDEWSWECHRCRHRGTVFELQGLVLEDADLLVRAWDRWSEEASGAIA